LKPKIYLAGPINDSVEQTKVWRNRLKEKYKDVVEFYDPVDFEIGHLPYNELVETDIKYIIKSDCIVANVWKYTPGTSMELVYAKFYMKKVLTLTKKELTHSWIKYHSSVVSFTEEDLDIEIEKHIAEFHEKGID
jgi:nucleoside 2-deoxyribosyltransferase